MGEKPLPTYIAPLPQTPSFPNRSQNMLVNMTVGKGDIVGDIIGKITVGKCDIADQQGKGSGASG